MSKGTRHEASHGQPLANLNVASKKIAAAGGAETTSKDALSPTFGSIARACYPR
jgi:hypothetical protein